MVLVGAAMGLMSGTLVYYHCAYRQSSVVSLMADVLIVLLCSLAILGLLFRHMNIAVPVDPLHWQISQDAASSLFACLANTLGAAESVLRVAATGHDKRLFLKVIFCLYLLSVVGRAFSGVAVAYIGLCLYCVYAILENSQTNSAYLGRLVGRRDGVQDNQ
ncbi:reticulon-like protein B23 isoform X1 [Salvia splendens]|uniref:reticulon-like protein B23 isoform X1 n=1 Tax=Salvia splendens TaxID=180675 RepID=UPI001C266D46|nr:reticulon-like protein B23 isoform X1 [Salvia splendens]XP_042007232.1 reticulon-like protein B23 isoform X1 [Salvia splendens]